MPGQKSWKVPPGEGTVCYDIAGGKHGAIFCLERRAGISGSVPIRRVTSTVRESL